MTQPTIVLVHGAWADGSSRNAVASELQRQGFTVLIPPNLLRGVADDAAYVASFLAQRTSGPVVLVGHSYGGFVITNAATGGDVRALVYVDAFIPDEGETVFQILGGRARRSMSPIGPRCSTSRGTPARPRATPRRSSSPTRCTARSLLTCPSRTAG
jgi:pimeloyl-ACP methyl ester carboxylesterase